jgi:8-oxo-dGTP pyrophosphatase MutT (NUDIX family)
MPSTSNQTPEGYTEKPTSYKSYFFPRVSLKDQNQDQDQDQDQIPQDYILMAKDKRSSPLYIPETGKYTACFPTTMELLGGNAEEGETPEQTVKREVREETGTGLELDEEYIKGLKRIDVEFNNVNDFKKEYTPTVVSFFFGRLEVDSQKLLDINWELKKTNNDRNPEVEAKPLEQRLPFKEKERILLAKVEDIKKILEYEGDINDKEFLLLRYIQFFDEKGNTVRPVVPYDFEKGQPNHTFSKENKEAEINKLKEGCQRISTWSGRCIKEAGHLVRDLMEE